MRIVLMLVVVIPLAVIAFAMARSRYLARRVAKRDEIRAVRERRALLDDQSRLLDEEASLDFQDRVLRLREQKLRERRGHGGDDA